MEPCEGMDDDEPECRLQGTGLFDTPHKELRINLDFSFNENRFSCERNVDLRWKKGEKEF